METGSGHGTLRRLFVYSLALLGVILTASGLSGIVRVALETVGGTSLVSETDRGLALGLSLTIVGLPIWALTWRAAQRAVRGSPEERRARGRRVFLALVRLIALAIAVGYAIQTGRWIVGAHAAGAEPVARFLVWGATWAVHESAARDVRFGGDHTRRVDRVEVYLAAAGGFALLAGATGDIVSRSLRLVYERAVGVDVLVGGAVAPALRTSVVVAVVGAAVWAWHWLVVARNDAASTGWYVHVFLVGVLSGTVATVVSASVLVHRALAWALGAVDAPAGVHFGAVPSAFAGLLVGGAIWGYHRAVLREMDDVDAAGWSAPERIHRYLVAAAGMLTTAGGIVAIVMVGLDLLVPGRTVVEAPAGIRDVVASGLTLLLVGVPLWAWSWLHVQRRVSERPEERNELTRRVLIFGAFGVAIVTTVVAGSVLLFELFDAALGGDLTVRLIEEQRWSIALLVAAGTISVHYGLVLREDRAHAPADGPRPGPQRLVLVLHDPGQVPEGARERLADSVEAWTRTDAPAGASGAVDVDVLDRDLRAVPTPRALVVVEADGSFRVIPVEG